VDGHDIARTDELVQFHVVDVAARAQLGGVQDDEDVVPVGADLGHGVALDAGLDRQGVEANDLPQHRGGLLVADGDVHPTSPSSRASNCSSSPTGCCWMPSSDTTCRSIPPATSWKQ
jgi:hypothetical protein